MSWSGKDQAFAAVADYPVDLCAWHASQGNETPVSGDATTVKRARIDADFGNPARVAESSKPAKARVDALPAGPAVSGVQQAGAASDRPAGAAKEDPDSPSSPARQDPLRTDASS